MVLIKRRGVRRGARWGVRIGLVALLGVAATAAFVPAPAGAAARPRTRVVASFYPLAWLAKAVGGDRVVVTDLTPSGVEPHDLELTPSGRAAIDDADLVLVVGGDFQPQVERAADQRTGATVVALDGPGARGAAGDPHVWLDPAAFATTVDTVERALSRADPGSAADYAANADRVRAELAALDADYRAGLADCERRTLVTSHDAFSRLAAAYDLEAVAVTGRAPDGEPDPVRLADLADLVRRRRVPVVFAEPLASRAVARALAREAGGVRVRPLDPVEGRTPRQVRQGDDYLTVMRRNLRTLRAGLGCT